MASGRNGSGKVASGEAFSNAGAGLTTSIGHEGFKRLLLPIVAIELCLCAVVEDVLFYSPGGAVHKPPVLAMLSKKAT